MVASPRVALLVLGYNNIFMCARCELILSVHVIMTVIFYRQLRRWKWWWSGRCCSSSYKTNPWYSSGVPTWGTDTEGSYTTWR